MEANLVKVDGKVTKVGPLRYTPGGTATRDISFAIQQQSFGKTSVGYIDLFLTADLAEDLGARLRIGDQLKVEGSLWSRTFKDRRDTMVRETKVFVSKISK